jgi:hypothetical protein
MKNVPNIDTQRVLLERAITDLMAGSFADTTIKRSVKAAVAKLMMADREAVLSAVRKAGVRS